MRDVPQILTDTWAGGEFTGARRPMARVTIQKLVISITQLDPTRVFASSMFNQADIPRELPNVKSVDWDRSIGSDVATCQIQFYNTAPLPLGQQPVTGGDLDQPGFYTYNYGATSWSQQRWGQHQPAKNGWQDYLVPDRVLRTYEGYGFSLGTAPEKDPHLVQTGVWLIDDVEYSTDGTITVSCRDLGRLLIDHQIFPPVIPLQAYPMEWDPYHLEDGPDVPELDNYSFRPTYLADSGIPYYGKNALIHGHRPSDAFDDKNEKSYWLSVGNQRPDAGYSFEWIEGSCAGRTVAAIQYSVYGGPYRVYLSVKIKGKWSGSKTIPYDPKNPVSHPNGANIPYSMVHTVGREGVGTFTLNHPVTGVDSVRLTFTHLFDSHIGPYRFRCGVRSVRGFFSIKRMVKGPRQTHGNYGDYTEIVKYLLACGGFWWPYAPRMRYMTNSDMTKTTYNYDKDDPFLTKGRIWGDLEDSGTTSFVDDETGDRNQLKSDVWDKKSLMDGIAYIRDILGFIFYIDETGGAVWRLPNLYTVGNFVGDLSGRADYLPGDTNIITIDERQTLLGLRAKISSKNIREYNLVGAVTGVFGAAAAGYNPITPDPKFRRYGIWTDQYFKDVTEAQKMADMISIRQMITYRTNSLQILANPAIQIDDQIRIYERLTGEGYLHWVSGISSKNDLESGRWTYDLTTNWLGEDPLAAWAVDRTKLAAVTQLFLDAILANRAGARGFYLLGGGAITINGKRKR